MTVKGEQWQDVATLCIRGDETNKQRVCVFPGIKAREQKSFAENTIFVPDFGEHIGFPRRIHD